MSKRPHGPLYNVDIDGCEYTCSQLFLRPAPTTGDVNGSITEAVEDENPNPLQVQRS